MRIVGVLLLVAGCDSLWNLEHVPPSDAFDVAQCPSDYDRAFWPGSRFRVVTTAIPAWEASDACNDDAAGATHLAVAATRDKLDALVGALTTEQGVGWWLGAVQPKTVMSPSPSASWLWVTGEPIDPGQWSANEPNDANDNEADHVEQFAKIDMTRTGLVDILGSMATDVLCECDGRPLTAEAIAAIEQSRP